MDFVIGGAHQGKLDFARIRFDVSDDDIFECEYNSENTDISSEIDFSRRCIHHTEKFALWCVKNGFEAKDYFEAHKQAWKDSVIICEDIFCGVVPIDADMRAWREMSGRLCTYLTREADSVTRIFCGLEQKLK